MFVVVNRDLNAPLIWSFDSKLSNSEPRQTTGGINLLSDVVVAAF